MDVCRHRRISPAPEKGTKQPRRTPQDSSTVTGNRFLCTESLQQDPMEHEGLATKDKPDIDIPNMGTMIPKLGIIMKATPVHQETNSIHASLSADELSLADALFTSTQQKVLRLLFGQPDRSYFVTQIMALAGAGRGAVQRELHRLEASGLATVQMLGTQKHYQANGNSPLFAELCSIVKKTVGLEEPLRTAPRPTIVRPTV